MFVATNAHATAARTVFLCTSFAARDTGTLFDVAALVDDAYAYGAGIGRELRKPSPDAVMIGALADDIAEMREDAALIRWAQAHSRCGYSVNAHGCAMYGCRH